MALKLSARSPVVRPRALDGGPYCTTGASQQVVSLCCFSVQFYRIASLSLPLYTKGSLIGWKIADIFYSSPCCHLADRLRVMSGGPDTCIVLRVLFFHAHTNKCMI